MADSTPAPVAATFETLLADLESVVERLERGDLALEAALEAFERGMALARDAGTVLDRAEARIEELVADRAAAPPAEG